MSIKIFAKINTRAGRTYAYRMLVSFKTLVTYKKVFNFTPNNFVRSEAAFVWRGSIFCRTLCDVRFSSFYQQFLRYSKQITDYIGKFLSPFLCGYRKGFSTQYALLSLIERWRLCLDKQGFAGALLMDLSKVFDTINHELLIAKLHAYGFSIKALEVLLS